MLTEQVPDLRLPPEEDPLRKIGRRGRPVLEDLAQNRKTPPDEYTLKKVFNKSLYCNMYTDTDISVPPAHHATKQVDIQQSSSAVELI